MQLRLVDRPEEFAALHIAWNRLHQRSARRSVFLSHEWMDAAWQWCRQDSDMYLLCVERGAELCGALPLVRRRAIDRHLGSRTLEFLSVPDTQHCDVLAAEIDSMDVINALADELVRRQADWDVLRLRNLHADSLAISLLQPALRRRKVRVDLVPVSVNPWIALDTSWETFYATRSRRLKKALNLAANRLTKAGAIEIRWLAPNTGDPADVERAIDDATTISARSWKTATGNSLENDGPQAFIRTLSRHAYRRGWLSVWILTLDGRPTAMEYQLVCNGEVFALRSDFDAAADEISPGSHLNRHMLELLFARNLSRYFMGPGGNAYKFRWTENADSVSTMTVYGASWRGRILSVWELRLKPGARRVRDRIRPIARAAGQAEADATAGTPRETNS